MLKTVTDFFHKHLLISTDQSSQDQEKALQLATASLLIEMTRADYEIKNIEMNRMTELLKHHFNLCDEQLNELIHLAENEADLATTYHDFTCLMNEHYSSQQKIHLIELLWEVAYADGHIDHYEDHFVRKIAELLYMPHSEFIAAKLRVISEPS